MSIIPRPPSVADPPLHIPLSVIITHLIPATAAEAIAHGEREVKSLGGSWTFRATEPMDATAREVWRGQDYAEPEVTT